MAKINIVIAGDYEGKELIRSGNNVSINLGGSFLNSKTLPLTKSTVESYSTVDENYRKSAKSAVGRGLVGGFLLGPVGLLAGGLSAKNKGSHTLQINFQDGKKSLVLVDDKLNSALIKTLI